MKELIIILIFYNINIVYCINEKWTSVDMWDSDSGSGDIIEIRLGYMTGASRKQGNYQYSRPGLTISGALSYALNDLKENKFFKNGNLRLRVKLGVAETYGDEEESIRQVANLWRERNVSVILGPQETCLHEAKLASSLNIPMISYFCSDEETSDKRNFPTFSRTRPPDAAISRAIASLVLKYGWTRSIVLIYSDSMDDPRFKRGAKSLGILFEEKGVGVHGIIPYRGPYHHGYGDNPFQQIVETTMDHTRIYIIISEYYEHLGLLLALKKRQLLENGEYLVIGVAMDDYKEDEWNPHRYFRGLLHDETDAETPLTFRSYLGIIASPPKNYTEFARQVNRHMELPPFDWPNPIARFGGVKKIRIEAAYLYDAVFLYANAVKSIIRDGISEGNNERERRDIVEKRLGNGHEISIRLRNVTFRSATGHESEMDENGDAVGNFTLLSLKNKEGGYGLHPVGYFVQHYELPELALRESIDWINGSPPVSEPECGFYGENCQSDNLPIIVSGVFVSIILFTGFTAYLVGRWKFSRDMDTLTWRIEKKDIEIELINSNDGNGKSGSQTSLAKFSTLFSPLVKYRGRIFAGKKLNMEVLVLDSPLKLQLKMLREIRHENLNAFIGACELDDGLLLLSEYCSRGSIRDILENGVLKLDDMFVSSLVGDLLTGLSYLHDSSSFRFHGNLKSTNCLIDSRWVLKLTDFGQINPESMKSFKQNKTAVIVVNNKDDNDWNTRNSIPGISSQSPYLPPEFLKLINGEVKNPIEGFRRGDIYSLGVILWELLKRESLRSFLKCKLDTEIQSEIFRIGNFWPKILKSLDTSFNIETERMDGSKSNDDCFNKTTSESVPSSPHGGGGDLSNTRLINSRRQSIYTPVSTSYSKQASVTNLLTTLPSSISQQSGGGGASGTNQIPSGSSVLITPQIIESLEACLHFDPELRPDLKSLRTKLRPLHKGMRSNIFDTMIALMEKYANNLERLVDERTKQLSEEKRKTDSLLYELIPASVAEELKEGLKVPAQSYEMVSIYFSDIVSFTSIAAESAPIQVVEFLNDLYTCFDSVIENFNVYKIETIGDAYMVASGLPVATEGNAHALEMARMALKLLETVTNFKIRHRPNETLNLRIGLHSGPVCAGVVGQKRPRYCLFGDTVNTASRMESTGLAHRIHCSEAFARLVEDEFEVERRGVVDVKGKGDMTTYWLIREKNTSSIQHQISLA